MKKLSPLNYNLTSSFANLFVLKTSAIIKLLPVFFMLAFFSFSSNVQAQNVNIPDANFKAALVGNSAINTNNDGEIQVWEAEAFTGNMNVSNLGITDLSGIENFTSLTALSCFQNSLNNINVSANTALIVLYCSYNNLSTLDVSANTALTGLFCDYMNLGSLDVSGNTALGVLSCRNIRLTILDVSANTALGELYCSGNNLSTLNLLTNTALYRLYCNNNYSLSTLNISANTALRELIFHLHKWRQNSNAISLYQHPCTYYATYHRNAVHWQPRRRI